MIIALCLQGCTKDDPDNGNGNGGSATGPSVTKTVSVGAQSGTLTAGRAGTVTYPVTTSNIASGAHAATVANLPGGMSVSGSVTVGNNSGTLTLAASTAVTAGAASNLTLTLDGATSAAFSLTIEAPPAASITITAQPAASTTVREGAITGSLTVAATVTQEETLTYQWFSNTANSNTGGTAVSGATSAVFAIPANLKEGAHYYFCEIKSQTATARSNVATVNVSAPATAAAIDVKISGTISHTTHTAGQKGEVTFSRFPATVDEYKQVRDKIGGEPHGAVALQIMAYEMYRRDRTVGEACIRLNNLTVNVNAATGRLRELFGNDAYYARPYQMAAFLKGATPENGYSPSKPYTVEVRVHNVNAYQYSSDYQASVLYLEVLTNGKDRGAEGVSVIKTHDPAQPSGGKYFIVFDSPGLYSQVKPISFTSTFDGLD